MQFENLSVWKRSRELTIDVYKRLRESREFGFKDQITRCALSVPSNISEGMERDYVQEKIRFLTIAKGSIGEFRTHVDIGVEVGFIEARVGKVWINEAKELSKMLASFIQTIKNTTSN